jgi:hypothetical protein
MIAAKTPPGIVHASRAKGNSRAVQANDRSTMIMRTLTHALLTEDEAVLVDGLDPSPLDNVLALFACGNGDAGLSLLQWGPRRVCIHDLFDPSALAAQFQMKRWLLTNLENATLRAFLGIQSESGEIDRNPAIEAAMRELPAAARSFWRPRIKCLRGGMARLDSTARWERLLKWSMERYRRMPSCLRGRALRVCLLLGCAYFPSRERRHSLGYRQLRRNPETVLERLIDRMRGDLGRGLIPYREFRYLSVEGQQAIRRHLDRVEVLDSLPPPVACNKIYLSNVIDYLPESRFHGLLESIASHSGGPWRAFLNSSYATPDYHPHLARGLDAGLFRLDAACTARLRSMDRVGVYPGITVVVGEGGRL